VRDIVLDINNLILSIIQNYNEGRTIQSTSITSEELTECIITLTINDLDIGAAYYTKTEGEPTVEKLMVNELKLRQANESRSRMKNKIDSLLLHIRGQALIPQHNTRVTNIDSFSAYLDRLATERIKEYYFRNKQNKLEEASHQVEVIKIILQKINHLFDEIDIQQGYSYIGEKRTFDEGKLITDVNKVLNNLK
jgi:hypothetical protein